jgi:hypothetical protein
MFGERGRKFNFNPKDSEHAGHANEQNYLDVAIYSALQKRYFLPYFPIITE